MTKRVLICKNGRAIVTEDRDEAENLATIGECTVLDVSRCSLQTVADMACNYGWSYGIEPFLPRFEVRWKDYKIDTSEEDWWDNQVGK